MGSILVGASDCFFVPRLCCVDQCTFYNSLPSLKFTIFIHLKLRVILLLPGGTVHALSDLAILY